MPVDLGCGVVAADADLRVKFVRAGGPGGQNVNKVATACQLFFDAARAPGLSDGVRRRLLELAGSRLTREGVLVIFADRHRTQELNRMDAVARLRALVAEASAPPPPKRRPTRPSRASVRRRLDGKALRGGVKAGRGRPRGED